MQQIDFVYICSEPSVATEAVNLWNHIKSSERKDDRNSCGERESNEDDQEDSSRS